MAGGLSVKIGSSRATLEIDDVFFAKIDRELSYLKIFDRMKVIEKGLRRAGNVVKRRYKDLITRPGYPGDKPDLKPLRETIEVKTKTYSSGRVVLIVGAGYPAGAHAHLLEWGHRKVLWGKNPASPGRVKERLWLTIATRQSKNEVESIIVDTIREAVEETKKSNPAIS